MKIKVSYTIEIRKGTNPPHFKRTYPAHSWTLYFMQQLYSQFREVWQGVLDTAGDLQALKFDTPEPHVGLYAPAEDNDYGLMVGTDQTALNLNHYSLQAKINHGNGGGQLYHNITAMTTVTGTDTEKSFTIARTFTNNSGGAITIREVGAYARGYEVALFLVYYMILRDIPGAPLVIADGETASLTYTFTITT